MPPPDLLPEIWARVIHHLAQPLPRPTGLNKRSDIRQPDLATAMRVSKVIVTDHLPTLAYNIGQPAAAKGIKSKSQLLEYCTALFVEYGEKVPSYTTLLQDGPELFPLYSAPTMEEVARACLIEAEGILTASMLLRTLKLKHLTRLSTGAFLGGQLPIWQALSLQTFPPSLDYDKKVAVAAAKLTLLVYNSEEKRSWYCHRVEYGPLVWIPSGASRSQPIEHRAHIDSHPGQMPPMYGGKSRWYLHFNDITLPSHIAHAGYYLGHAVMTHIQTRERMFKLPAYMAKALTISADVYLPPFLMTPEAQQKMRSSVEQAKVESGIATSQYADQWELKKMADAPACEACGWCVDNLTDARPDKAPFSFERGR